MPFKKLSFVVLPAVVWAAAARAENWPQFRGANHGVSQETGLPVTWSAARNVKWRTTLPGPGHSSPVVWGDRIFLTAFKPVGSGFFGGGRGRLLVLSLDRASGRILWEREVPASKIETTHPTNAPATPTPVTDGTRVYVYFGSHGLTAFDFEGRKVWEKPLGPFRNEWGSASSPILHGEMLLLVCDTDSEAFVTAVEKATGRTLWQARRESIRAWPAPLIWQVGGGDQLVVSGSKRVKGYDVKTGREVWTVEGLTHWVAPTPSLANGLLYVASNGPGGNAILAIKPGGRGDVTSSHVAWRYERAAPYTSSPVVYADHLYAVKDGGVMTCLDARTGALVWQERLPSRSGYFASLVAGDGRVYALSDDGDTSVVAAGKTFKVLATNALGERTMATPAIANGQIFIRTDQALLAVGEPAR